MARALLLALVLILTAGPPALAGPDDDEAPPAVDRDRDAALKRAAALDDRVYELYKAGKFAAALPLARESLALHEAALGPDAPDTADRLSRVALLLKETGALPEARTLLERAVAIVERTEGPDHPVTARGLENLGSILNALGETADAIRVAERVVAIRERALGPDAPDTGAALSNLGILKAEAGDLEAARRLQERALEICEKKLGPKHRRTIGVLNNLAALLREMGDLAAARPVLERAAAGYEALLGPGHPSTLGCLTNLAILLEDLGDLEAARRLEERLLATRERVLGPKHPETARGLGNLGAILSKQGDIAGALRVLERSLSIREEVFGWENHETHRAAVNLAFVLVAAGETDRALALGERALAAVTSALGPDHPLAGQALTALGAASAIAGDRHRARDLLGRSLLVRERALGPSHPMTALAAGELARCLDDMGDRAAARPLLERALQDHERMFLAAFGAASERQRLGLVEVHRKHLESYLIVFAGDEARRLAACLRWKGVVGRVLAEERALSRARGAGELAGKLERLRTLKARLARAYLTFHGHGAAAPAAALAGSPGDLEAIAREKEALEVELAGASVDLGAARALAGAGLAEVAAAIPAGAALVEVLAFRDRLFAWVLRASAPAPVFIDLGPEAPIEAAVTAFRAALERRAPEAEIRARGRDVVRLAWTPLAAALEGCETVLIAPDGSLAALPFAALPATDEPAGPYLIEQRTIGYLASGVDLACAGRRARGPHSPRGAGLLAVGGVEFGAGGRLRFPALPGTAAEARAVLAGFQARSPAEPAFLLEAGAATEAAVKRLAPGRRVLHLATHGFFAGGPAGELVADARGSPRIAAGSGTAAAPAPPVAAPMALSGVVLAGANAGESGPGEDGLLTAEEVSGLDLDGLDLVVLSACDTGLGEVRRGEGVLGLARGFAVAGARTLVLSLFPVPDETTRELMIRFHAELFAMQSTFHGPVEALRRAQLAVLAARRAAGDAAPWAWGGFIAAGAPPQAPARDDDARELERAAALDTEAVRLHAAGRYAEALAAAREAVAIKERLLGPDHAAVGASLTNAGAILQAQGLLAEALPVLSRALAICEATLGAEHVATAKAVSNLASVHYAAGDPAAARPLFERALAIAEKIYGPDDPGTADSLVNLGVTLQDLWELDAARVALARALAIHERASGKDHPATAAAASGLGRLLTVAGDLVAARPLFERALAIDERRLGPDHPMTAVRLHNLGALLVQLEDGAEAEPLLERALAIRERTFGEEHPAVASTLHGLVILHLDLGRLEAAQRLAERALAITERAFGPDHSATAHALHSLATVTGRQGDLGAARRASERALAILDGRPGLRHDGLTTVLVELGSIAFDAGDVAAARYYHGRALLTLERMFGPDSAATAGALANVGAVLAATGERDAARALLDRALAIHERCLGTTFAVASERQRIGLVAGERFILDTYLEVARGDEERRLAAVLRWKAAVRRALVAERTAARASGDPEARALLERLESARSRLARAFVASTAAASDPLASTAPPRPEVVRGLAREKEAIEVELARRSAAFREELALADVDLAAVRAAIPGGAALVEVFVFHDRYGAWILRGGSPRFVDLGPAAEVEAAVVAFRESLAGRRADGSGLTAKVWRPIRDALGDDATLVIIAPDGALAEVPFAALADGDAYLVERYTFAYVASGADLVRPADRGPTGRGVLAVGGVDYDAGDGAPTFDFGALPATAAEAAAVVERFRARFGEKEPATLLAGAAATEALVKRLAPGRRVLHLATHGFLMRESRALVAASDDRGSPRIVEDRATPAFEPMLRSGVALAGANRGGAGDAGEDGILTAEEVAGLALDGLDLAVLSACETGRGEVRRGEGVLGLARGMSVAGARSLVISLWEVPDEGTRELMVRFYEELLADPPATAASPVEALRRAQLGLLAAQRSAGEAAAPWVWGGFIVLGAP